MSANHASPDNAPRRDFLLLTAQAMGAVGAGALLWPLVDSMNPSADVLALASTEVDLSAIAEGQERVVANYDENKKQRVSLPVYFIYW